MCICCCICNCCNSYSSKCVEFCILLLSSITLICSILGFIFIKWSHLTITCSILLILAIIFSIFITLSSVCINIFRYKGIINKNRNLISTYFAIISLILTIITLLMSFVAESLVQTNFNDIDYPCKNVQSNDPNIIVFRLLSLEIISDQQRNEFCKDKNIDYNAKICSNIEYTMAYLTSTVIEFCTLILCFFWYNDYRRIREKVDGELPIYDNTYITEARIRNAMNFREGDQYDPSERYFNQNQNNLVQSNVVLVNKKSSRKSQQYNINKNKQNGGNNFIRNLRKEMEEAIESLDEESSENKENNNKNNKNEVDNIEDLLYSEKNSNNNNEKKSSISKDNNDDNEKKSNISKNNDDNEKKSSNISKDDDNEKKSNIIFIDEENKDGTIEENLQKNDISIYKGSMNNSSNSNNYNYNK